MSTPGEATTSPLVSSTADDDDSTTWLVAAAVTVVAGVVAAVFFLVTKKLRGPPKVMPLDDFITVPLSKKEALSHDTVRFTFSLPDSNQVLGLPLGQHLLLKFIDNEDNTNKAVQRSYTPVTDDTTSGQFSLVIKVYKPNPPKFPHGGAMSQHLHALQIGDTILVKGPKGHLHFHKNCYCGRFAVKPLGKPLEHRTCTTIGMMAGGTGLTPMLQLLRNIFLGPHASTNAHLKVRLLYANQTPSGILLKSDLDDLAKQFPDRFQVWYTVDRMDDGEDKDSTWKYDTGFITKDMVQQHVVIQDGSSKQQQFFLCGPPPMIKYACLPALKELGYSEKDWVIF